LFSAAFCDKNIVKSYNRIFYLSQPEKMPASISGG